MITIKAAGTLVSIKAHKEFRAKIGDNFSASVPVNICHLFEPQTGNRI
jgi:multiple sugar transport system ATP-binding protein